MAIQLQWDSKLAVHYSKIVKKKKKNLFNKTRFIFPLTCFPFRAYLLFFSLIFFLLFSSFSLNPSRSSLPSTHAAKPISVLYSLFSLHGSAWIEGVVGRSVGFWFGAWIEVWVWLFVGRSVDRRSRSPIWLIWFVGFATVSWKESQLIKECWCWITLPSWVLIILCSVKVFEMNILLLWELTSVLCLLYVYTPNHLLIGINGPWVPVLVFSLTSMYIQI